MKRLRLTHAILAFFISLNVSAATCDVTQGTSELVIGRNFTIEMPTANVTVIGRPILDEIRRQDLFNLFVRRDLTPQAVIEKGRELLTQYELALKEDVKNRDYLNRFLFSEGAKFIVVDLESNEIAKLEKVAQALVLNAYAQTHYLGASSLDWDSLLLLALGPAIDLKVHHPDLFKGTPFIAQSDLPPSFGWIVTAQQRLPSWMGKILGNDLTAASARSDSAIEGEGIYFIDQDMLPLASANLLRGCLTNKPGAEPTTHVPFTDGPTPDSSRGRHSPEISVTSTSQTTARQLALARHAMTYSWITRDRLGHVYKHTRMTH